jgi:hypothetical protein
VYYFKVLHSKQQLRLLLGLNVFGLP